MSSSLILDHLLCYSYCHGVEILFPVQTVVPAGFCEALAPRSVLLDPSSVCSAVVSKIMKCFVNAVYQLWKCACTDMGLHVSTYYPAPPLIWNGEEQGQSVYGAGIKKIHSHLTLAKNNV